MPQLAFQTFLLPLSHSSITLALHIWTLIFIETTSPTITRATVLTLPSTSPWLAALTSFSLHSGLPRPPLDSHLSVLFLFRDFLLPDVLLYIHAVYVPIIFLSWEP